MLLIIGMAVYSYFSLLLVCNFLCLWFGCLLCRWLPQCWVWIREGGRYAALSSVIHWRWGLELGWQLQLASECSSLPALSGLTFWLPRLLRLLEIWTQFFTFAEPATRAVSASLYWCLSASLRLLISHYHILESLMLLAPFTSDKLEIYRVILIWLSSFNHPVLLASLTGPHCSFVM